MAPRSNGREELEKKLQHVIEQARRNIDDPRGGYHITLDDEVRYQVEISAVES